MVSLKYARMKKTLHRDIILIVIQFQDSFKWQYMAGAGAGAEIMDKKGGAGAENK